MTSYSSPKDDFVNSGTNFVIDKKKFPIFLRFSFMNESRLDSDMNETTIHFMLPTS